jgi:hypothetical protein
MVHLGRPHGTAEKQNPAPKKQATAKSTGGRPKGTKEKFPIAPKESKKPQAGKTRSGASYRGKPVKVKHADMITFLTLHRALGEAMLRNPERYN